MENRQPIPDSSLVSQQEYDLCGALLIASTGCPKALASAFLCAVEASLCSTVVHTLIERNSSLSVESGLKGFAGEEINLFKAPFLKVLEKNLSVERFMCLLTRQFSDSLLSLEPTFKNIYLIF